MKPMRPRPRAWPSSNMNRKFRIAVGQRKKRRIEYEKDRLFLNHAGSNPRKACHIPVEFSPNETWVKPVAIAGEGALMVDRTEAGKVLGRRPGIHLGIIRARPDCER